MWKDFILHLVVLFFSLLVTSHGGCQLPTEWAGKWFQSGVGRLTTINSTHIETKGDCFESSGDKFVLADRSDKSDMCYRCVVMHVKHPNVLQYKETYCSPHDSLESLCNQITGDATLLSLFRAVNAKTVVCPFKAPPYSFSYNRGYGDCDCPLSRVDSCTDDTKLLLRYQACPDVEGTEATVEELECLAVWREGSSRYLVGKLRHKMTTTDEDKYRCFVYEQHGHDFVLAQSGDATCNGLSPTEGYRTMKLTRIESQHLHCRFPNWVTDHSHWHSLDARHNYHFSHRNATLKVTTLYGVVEKRLQCHSIYKPKHSVQDLTMVIAHIVSGCDGGYGCIAFHRRDANILQMQESAKTTHDPDDACSPTFYSAESRQPPVTFITGTLPLDKCPYAGRYQPSPVIRRGQKRHSAPEVISHQQECINHVGVDSISVGCSSSGDIIELHHSCPNLPATGFYCHGSWHENTTLYVIASPVSRQSTDARHYCFLFTMEGSETSLQRIADSCLPSITNQIGQSWAFNLTQLGKCTESSISIDTGSLHFPSLLCIVSGLFFNFLR